MMSRRLRHLGPLLLAICSPACADGAPRADGDQPPSADSAARVRAADSARLGRVDTGMVHATTRITTLAGVLTIEERDVRRASTARVKVDGRTVLADSSSLSVRVQAYWHYPSIVLPVGADTLGRRGAGPTALIRISREGIGCPVEHRIVELVDPGSVAVTEPFGSCGGEPDSVWFQDGTLRMRFQEYVLRSPSEEADYVPGPPTTWIYHGRGRLEKVRGR
jgi:hypothetical protein